MSDTKNNKNNKEWMAYIGLATQWMVMLSLAVWLGIYLDKQISTNSKLLTVLLPLLALFISLHQLVTKILNKKK